MVRAHAGPLIENEALTYFVSAFLLFLDTHLANRFTPLLNEIVLIDFFYPCFIISRQ